MAISDTLYGAVEEMRRYLANGTGMYDDRKPRIEKLIADMKAMRVELDAPPKEPITT